MAVDTVLKAGGNVDFVELTCPFFELRQRVDSPSRRAFRKLTSAEMLDQLHREGALNSGYMPKPAISIDTSRVTPLEAAREITRQLGLR
jgi:hypothetical protein